MTSRQMVLGMQFSGGYGAAPGAWLLPGANLNSFTDMDQLRYAQAAERGKIQLLFIADTPVLDLDLDHHAPHHMIDPLLIPTVLARETERIGLVTTASTTFTEPYNLARQFKALDVISHGRAGWNAVTTSDPAAAANFGATIPQRAEKYERAQEVIQIVQGLWGSWEKDAWLLDVDGERFADMDKIQPVNMQGSTPPPVARCPSLRPSMASRSSSRQAAAVTAWNSRAVTPAASTPIRTPSRTPGPCGTPPSAPDATRTR